MGTMLNPFLWVGPCCGMQFKNKYINPIFVYSNKIWFFLSELTSSCTNGFIYNRESAIRESTARKRSVVVEKTILIWMNRRAYEGYPIYNWFMMMTFNHLGNLLIPGIVINQIAIYYVIYILKVNWKNCVWIPYASISIKIIILTFLCLYLIVYHSKPVR